MEDFYSNPILSKEAMTSFITLVPNVDNPHHLVNYRPICLVSTFQKILSKVLTNRLKKVIGSLITAEQTTFLAGRSMYDGVVVVNEILDLA